MSFSLRSLRDAVARLRPSSPSETRQAPGIAVSGPVVQRLSAPIPRGVIIPPSMMSEAEQAVLFNLAKDAYTGAGLIVDAGIFLGASTCCFGEGLLRNPARKRAVETWAAPIVSCELGIVNKTMQAFFARHELPVLAEGDSLAPTVGANIARVRALVDLRIGDIVELGSVHAPIEILFLDCLKHEKISRFAVESYFPRLRPGAFVIQQDYLSDMLPFIKVHQEFFADYFDYAGECASSAIFQCRREIPASAITGWRDAMGDPDRQIELIGRSQDRTGDPARKILVALSMMRLIGTLKGIEAARTCFAAIKLANQELLAGPGLPRRVHNAIAGAEALCASAGTRRDFIDAQLISLGHPVPERPEPARKAGGPHRRGRP